MANIPVTSEVVELIQRVLREYYSATATRYPDHSVHHEITRNLPNALEKLLPNKGYLVKGHDGKGNWAHVPWIGVSREHFHAGGQRGVYLAILFSRMGKAVFFSLQQGSEASNPAQLSLIGDRLRKRYGLVKGVEMDLESQATRPRRYKDADVFNIEIPAADISIQRLTTAFSEILPLLDRIADDFVSVDAYEEWVREQDHSGVKNSEDEMLAYPRTTGVKKIMSEIIKAAGDQSRNLLHSSLANPFVILTGTSGSGKTRLAHCIASMLGENARSCLIPVGADWTDNRHVLGYVNHLVRDEETNLPVYQTTPIVRLLLAANDDKSHPYFLILDEMNLSHVERYFADFLSKMESGDEIVFHTEVGSLKGSDGVDVPASIPCIPPNLFVIGTVNVDETTYMFSPKVLDRAQVIEFRVSPEEAQAYLGTETGGNLPEPKPNEEAGRAFLELSLRARGLSQPALADPEHVGELKKALGDLFELMHDRRMEFAYRTMNEVLRYARVSFELAEDKSAWSWSSCLDTQILQKVLPKLHGNKKRLEPVLMDLIRFCESGERPDMNVRGETVLGGRIPKPTGGVVDKVLFRRSYEKLCDMLEAVRRDQYVSFIQ